MLLCQCEHQCEYAVQVGEDAPIFAGSFMEAGRGETGDSNDASLAEPRAVEEAVPPLRRLQSPPRCAATAYLQLVAAMPSAHSFVPPGAAPTPLEAAQRRLAVSMVLSQRLGDDTRHLCDADLTAEVGRRMLGFDHYAELGKLQSFGEAAAMARSIVIPAPHCSLYATVGLVPARDAPPVCWQYFNDGCKVVQVGGLRVCGHYSRAYNGTYAAVDERDGWPVLQNEHGVWLFRSGLQGVENDDTWRLWHQHTWNVDRCNSYINTDGSFPMGAVVWKVFDDVAKTFQRRTLTMQVVVRAILAAHVLYFSVHPAHQTVARFCLGLTGGVLVQLQPYFASTSKHLKTHCRVVAMYVCRASVRRTLCGVTQTRSLEGA